MKRLLPFLKPYRKESVMAPLFKLLEAFFDLLVPIVIKSIIDKAIPLGVAGDRSYLFEMCGLLVLLAVVGVSVALLAQYYAAKAAVGFASDLRYSLFAKIQTFSYSQTDRAGTASLITRMTADVNQIQSGVNMFLRLLLRSPIIVFGAMILSFTVNFHGALVFAVLVPILFAIVTGIILAGIPLYKKVQESLERSTSVVREHLYGIRVIRAFRKENEEVARFTAANEEQTALQNRVGKISALMNPLTLIPIDLGIAVLLLSGAVRVNVGEMSQGDVVALVSYMSQILVELVKFTNTVFTVNRALACAGRVEDLLDTPSDEKSPVCGLSATSGTSVCFRDVGLTYSQGAAPSLSGISFAVAPGEVLGIIGSTGSGKTSVVNLICGFYPATAGNVFVMGKDLRAYTPKELRKTVAVVPQKAVLFRGTVRSNLLFGNENASEDDLKFALDAAQATSFVMERDGGLDATVMQGGKNFSGGQRQRLTIARAILSRSEILILDDSSSALDYATDASLRSALKKLPWNPTVVTVSQRTSSIRHADRILVLEDGKQAGFGTHEELLENCPVYREIHESQFRRGGDAS